MIAIYNTYTKSKEKFIPFRKGKVSIYTCGPTVYDFIHIGNLRAYVMADILRRFLTYRGYEVRHIKNITDVGHLTADDVAQGDSGEDKIGRKAKIEKKSPEEIARFYERAFYSDEAEMNILPAHYFPRATAHIDTMIKLIEELIKKGYAYEKNGNVFFDVTKFSDYGKLSGNTLEKLKVGARLERHPDKKNPWDFALWLKATPDHLMQWDSPWSRGYPGWHIECSAMSSQYLETPIDIHTGGEDNIFPHHEAEIAQSEAASGKKFVNYWLHVRHLLVNGDKMSKSKNNVYKLADIKKRGYSPMHLRWFLMSAHYRKHLDFSWQALDQARANYQKIANWLDRVENIATIKLKDLKEKVNSIRKSAKLSSLYLTNFEKALDDDLNTPKALSETLSFIIESNKKLDQKSVNKDQAIKDLKIFNQMNFVLGLTFEKKRHDIPEEVTELAQKRLLARKNKDFQKADAIRREIETLGFEIEDLEEDYIVKPK